MKVTCVMGSPRKKGNSATLARAFLARAEELGADCTVFELNKLEFRGCQACMTCKTKLDHCALDDGLSPVLASAFEADVLVVASPVYYGDVNAQTKAFIDRTYSFLKPDYLTSLPCSRQSPGKKCLWILTQGNPDPAQFQDVFQRYSGFLQWYGYQPVSLVRGLGLQGPDEAAARAGLLEEAAAQADKLLG